MRIRILGCTFGLGISLLGCDLALHSSHPTETEKDVIVKKDSGTTNPQDPAIRISKYGENCYFNDSIFMNGNLGRMLEFGLQIKGQPCYSSAYQIIGVRKVLIADNVNGQIDYDVQDSGIIIDNPHVGNVLDTVTGSYFLGQVYDTLPYANAYRASSLLPRVFLPYPDPDYFGFIGCSRSIDSVNGEVRVGSSRTTIHDTLTLGADTVFSTYHASEEARAGRINKSKYLGRKGLVSAKYQSRTFCESSETVLERFQAP